MTLAKSAAIYYEYRFQLIDAIQSELVFLEHLLEKKYSLSLRYITKVSRNHIEQSILEYLVEKQERDLIL